MNICDCLHGVGLAFVTRQRTGVRCNVYFVYYKIAQSQLSSNKFEKYNAERQQVTVYICLIAYEESFHECSYDNCTQYLFYIYSDSYLHFPSCKTLYIIYLYLFSIALTLREHKERLLLHLLLRLVSRCHPKEIFPY